MTAGMAINPYIKGSSGERLCDKNGGSINMSMTLTIGNKNTVPKPHNHGCPGRRKPNSNPLKNK